MLKVAALASSSLKEVSLEEQNQLVLVSTTLLENSCPTNPSKIRLVFQRDLKTRLSSFKVLVMSDTGLLNSSMVMALRSLVSLNITQLSTTQRVLTQMMPRNISMKTAPSKDIQELRKLPLKTHFHSWKRNAIS